MYIQKSLLLYMIIVEIIIYMIIALLEIIIYMIIVLLYCYISS
jgi:hypothetical protein